MQAAANLRNIYDSIFKYRYVVYSFVYTNVKLRYRRSYLGFVWTLLAPMLHYIMIGLMMNLLLRSKMDSYLTYYFSGAIYFSLVNGVLSKAPAILINNEHYIKKIPVPKIIFILNVVCYELVNFTLSGLTLGIIGAAMGKLVLSPWILTSLLALVLLAIFLFGIACMLSVLTVYFRDFNHIIPVLLQALFFVTPVTYSKEMIPPEFHWIVKINPVSYFLDVFRTPLLTGESPDLRAIAVILIASIVSFLIGIDVVRRFDNKIVFKL